MDSQSVKTTEMRGFRGFDGHKRVNGRKRYILVDTLGLPIAKWVEPANLSDRKGGERLVVGLGSLWSTIRTVIADGGHKSTKLAAKIKRREGWRLVIVKRSECAFKINGLTWIVERTFAWLGCSRRFARDYERCPQASETMIDIATVRLMISKLAPNLPSHTAAKRAPDQFAVHAAARMAEIKKRVTPHILRHSFATHLLEQDIDIRVIQVLMGHAKLNSTVIDTQVATNTIRSVMSPPDTCPEQCIVSQT